MSTLVLILALMLTLGSCSSPAFLHRNTLSTFLMKVKCVFCTRLKNSIYLVILA